ncbi:C6 finger domain-containingprotein [Purpureocillium lilacinum]|uniref:C6 finger domain-containingprotein n=1 Tax=Purpureocillium lilacinum TaxID=33203 RepID=A0A179G1W9_PURLI|nr:C6 finger domain-containingprotein [Purpureocillium lilacinum]
MATFSFFSSGPGDARGRRSKGCLTCRKRKVKCDERRPTCERCEKGYHHCLGYDQPLIFVNKGVGVAPPPQGPRNRKLSPDTGSSGSASDSETSFAIITRPSSSVGYVKPMLKLDGFKDDIVISHLITKLAAVGHQFSKGTDAPTLAGVLTASNGKSVAYIAGLSLAEAFFGRIHRVQGMLDHSATLYGRALRSLREDLVLLDRGAGLSRAYMNLWSTIFLGMYEMVSNCGSSNWLEHSRGVSALTHALGPHAFQNPSANTILSFNRSYMAIGHIPQRKRCFLGEPEWQTIPWALQETERPIGSKIIDVLCEIPGLMAERDMLAGRAAKVNDVEAAMEALQDRVLDAIRRLGEYRWQWEAAYPRASRERLVNMATSVSLDEHGRPLFDTVLDFDDMERAIDVVYFNTIRLMLYGLSDDTGLSELLMASSGGGCLYQGPSSNALLLPGQGTNVSNALEICRTVDYFMQHSRDSQGTLVLLFPLRVAYGHLRRVPLVSPWIRRILVDLSTSKGFQIGEHILNMGMQTTDSP